MIKCPKCDKVLSGLDMELYDTYCDGHEYCRVNYCRCPECGHKFEDEHNIKILGTPYIPEEYDGECIVCGEKVTTPAYAARTM